MSQRYAMMAERHWKEHLPERYAALTDPAEFFRARGEEAAEMVETLSESLATSALESPVSPDETFHERASRLVQARHAAEATVVREFLYPVPEEETDPEEQEIEDGLMEALAEFQRLREQFYEEMDEARARTQQ